MELKDKVKEALTFSCYIYHKEDVLEYEVGPDNNLVGQRNKDFYRIDRRYFSKYFDNAMFGLENSYVTYISEAVKEGAIPEHLSAVKKVYEGVDFNHEMSNYEIVYNEVLGSQILNFFECPTVYNVAVFDKESEMVYLLSLDFISKDEEFFSFDDRDLYITSYLRGNVDRIEDFLSSCSYCKEEDKKHVLEDFVYSSLVRKFVLRDYDFYHTNIGLLVGDNVHFINYDYEYILKEPVQYYINDIVDSLEYTKEEFPNIYNKFVSHLLDFYKGIKELIENDELDLDSDVKKVFMFSFLTSLRMTFPILNKLGMDVDVNEDLKMITSMLNELR